MNLAYKYPIIFWNCACLISDAGGNEDEDEVQEDFDPTAAVKQEYYNEMEEFTEDDNEEDIEDSYDEDEDCDGYPVEVCKMADGKKKKKVKATNYGKISVAIGKITAAGVKVSCPDINSSLYTFSPDVETNTIRYGLSGITRVSEDLIKTIIANRPYVDLEDFLEKVKVNKLQMTNLIKSGAFDCFGGREAVMKEYILMVSDQKKRITLQNMAMLIEKGFIPEEYQFEIKVFNFNKYLKKHKDGIYYELDEIAERFYNEHFDIDLTVYKNSKKYIEQKEWDKIYKKQMDPVRAFLKANASELLYKLNLTLFNEMYDKYATGTISKWEMDSLSCYNHEHELVNVDNELYNFADFYRLPEEPVVERYIPIRGQNIPIYKTYRFAGTVLDRDKAKGLVTLLTTTGVITVRIYKSQFVEYDKQISERGADGKKHVIEKSWFSRGNKLIINGFRRGDEVVLKKYKSTPYSVVSLITSINNGLIEYKSERQGECISE